MQNSLKKPLIISHLCLIFTWILTLFLQPFTTELYEIKKEKILLTHVMGKGLSPHKERFQSLPDSLKEQIITKLKETQAALDKPFFEKLIIGYKNLLITSSPFIRAYLFFSLILSILILKEKEGALEALPLLMPIALALLYVGPYTTKTATPDETLIPSEKEILNIQQNFEFQQQTLSDYSKLKKGFEYYLIDQWAGDTPSNDPMIFQKQLEKGDFNFHLERIRRRFHFIKKPLSRSRIINGLLVFWTLILIMGLRDYSHVGSTQLHIASHTH